MSTISGDTYDDVRRALDDDARSRSGRHGNGGKWPQWIQTVIMIGAMFSAVILAYAALDKRMSLLEQKVDFVIQKVK
jgi:hypothetical protein